MKVGSNSGQRCVLAVMAFNFSLTETADLISVVGL